MVTGYNHLLFLLGVTFFLYKPKHIGIYVSLFAIGHSATLLFGVLVGTAVSPFLIDAIIGLSIIYKALDNMGAYQRWFGYQPNTKAALRVAYPGFSVRRRPSADATASLSGSLLPRNRDPGPYGYHMLDSIH